MENTETKYVFLRKTRPKMRANTASMMIFLNSGSKQAATGFPTGCTSSPTGSSILLHDVADLLYEIIVPWMTKKIKSKLDGTIFFID